MWNAVKEMLGSKKALATCLSVVAWFANKVFDYQLPVEELLLLLAPVWVYVFAQGQADKGKEAKKLELKAGSDGGK